MPVTTVTVAAAVTPTVIHTYLSHYLNRKPLRQKPTAHISYHEGLELIRRFLHFASFHTVGELQAFTSQWVPVPAWVNVEVVNISAECLAKSTALVEAQLGPHGIEQVGGVKWWQWRPSDAPLRAEWIEMKKDMYERTSAANTKGQRIMLYVHGGAYFFGSVDEHRYQMQRHARKLQARVIAPRYRLAPQYPFPCGLMDCLATYLHLLETGHDPSTILLAGDSAGGGMVLSILVTLRDQAVPLPAGAILISPWVDLTHSFPSLGGDGKLDYIPAHGFVHKPSIDWPPPNADDFVGLEQRSRGAASDGAKSESEPPGSSGPSRKSSEGKRVDKEKYTERVLGFSVRSMDREPAAATREDQSRASEQAQPDYVAEDGRYMIGPKSTLSVNLGGTLVEIKDQIQLYAANHLLTHPLVSPVLQPTLGGLPPLLVQVGGGELLRDEQIYLAHKAASPLSYPPRPSNHLTAEFIQTELLKHRPTNVQLQVWDDLCHVAPTLSFTRPAKFMYRSVAQFGAWALARAQKSPIDILDDDAVSIVSKESSSSSTEESNSNLRPDDIKLNMPRSAQNVEFQSVSKKRSQGPAVGKAGDPLPPFLDHMIRQRVDRHGTLHDLPAPSEIPALSLPPSEVGVPKEGPLGKWMRAQKEWNQKFAKEKIKVQKQRLRDMTLGYEGFDGETPPPTAVAGRRVKGIKKEKKKRSWGMALWSVWGSQHDKMTLIREEKADAAPPHPPSSMPQKSGADAANVGIQSTSLRPQMTSKSRSHSRSRHTAVTDQGQAVESREDPSRLIAPDVKFAEAILATSGTAERRASPLPSPSDGVSSQSTKVGSGKRSPLPDTLILPSTTFSTRPTRGGVAYPFRLKVDNDDKDVNASTLTLHSVALGPSDAGNVASSMDSEINPAASDPNSREPRMSRPHPERFVTAETGQPSDSAYTGSGKSEDGNARPQIDRFETAQEKLPTRL